MWLCNKYSRSRCKYGQSNQIYKRIGLPASGTGTRRGCFPLLCRVPNHSKQMSCLERLGEWKEERGGEQAADRTALLEEEKSMLLLKLLTAQTSTPIHFMGWRISNRKRQPVRWSPRTYVGF